MSSSAIRQHSEHPAYPLLYDPQTSGGLLVSMSADAADAYVQAVQALGEGFECATIVGEVTEKPFKLMADQPDIELRRGLSATGF